MNQNVLEAINLVEKQNPDKVVTKYWITEDGIIVFADYKNFLIRAAKLKGTNYYLVNGNEIIPTNPAKAQLANYVEHRVSGKI